MDDHNLKYVSFKDRRASTYYTHNKEYIRYRKYPDNVVSDIILHIVSQKYLFYREQSDLLLCYYEDNEIRLPKDISPSCFNFSCISKGKNWSRCFKTSFPHSLIKFPGQSRTFLECAYNSFLIKVINKITVGDALLDLL